MVNDANRRRASAAVGHRSGELSRVSTRHLSRSAGFDRPGGASRARRRDGPDLREGHRAREAAPRLAQGTRACCRRGSGRRVRPRRANRTHSGGDAGRGRGDLSGGFSRASLARLCRLLGAGRESIEPRWLELRSARHQVAAEGQTRARHPARELFQTDRRRAGPHADRDARAVGNQRKGVAADSRLYSLPLDRTAAIGDIREPTTGGFDGAAMQPLPYLPLVELAARRIGRQPIT